MTVDINDLLKPRYKLKIRYPHYPFDGDILFVDKDGELYHETEGYCQSIYKIMESDAKESKCFALMFWWEERKESEIGWIEYLVWKNKDGKESPFKLMKLNHKRRIAEWNTQGYGPPLSECEPITKEEYETYISTLKQ